MKELAEGDERLAKELEEYLRDSSFQHPPAPTGVSSHDWKRMQRDRRKGRAIQLPPGMSPEQEAAIREALREVRVKIKVPSDN